MLFRLCFSLFTLTISQKFLLFILFYLLMISIFICQTLVSMFFRQLLTLNYVKLNTGNKTNFMLLNSLKHNPISYKIIVNNHSISPEDKLKYLGVLLDNMLSWKPHVQKVKIQLSRGCGVLTKLKHYTTQFVLKVVYNSLIHPHLNYSILNWGRASNATIQPFIMLKYRAMKIIKPTNTKSLEPFQRLNILSLP